MTWSESDYLPDEALAKIEANVPRMAQDFELEVSNAWAKSAQVMFRWERPDDVFKRGDSIYALVEGAMCVDTLCKNLRAARAAHTTVVVDAKDLTPAVTIRDATPDLDVIVVPRSFVESVLYSGAFEGEDLDRLHRQAEELLGVEPAPFGPVLAQPYDARQCPECGVWVYTADGPFAENDRTKTEADWLHWRDEHGSGGDDEIAPGVIGFPFFRYNDEPVQAVKEHRELDP